MRQRHPHVRPLPGAVRRGDRAASSPWRRWPGAIRPRLAGGRHGAGGHGPGPVPEREHRPCGWRRACRGEGDVVDAALDRRGPRATGSPSSMWAIRTASSWWTTPPRFDVAGVGAVIERHPLFPNRVNVEFIRVEPDGSVRMRVWERGVGETQACGTGATAVGAACVRLGLAASPVLVHLLGGDLDHRGRRRRRGAGRRCGSARVFMTGPAEEVSSRCRALLNRPGWPARLTAAAGVPAAPRLTGRPRAAGRATDRRGGDRAVLPADGQSCSLSLCRDGAQDRREAQERGGRHQPGHRRSRSAHPGLHRRGDAAPGGRPAATIAIRATGAWRSSARRRPPSTSAVSAWSSIPTKEFFPLLGAKEGLAHICWALLDAGDLALVPDPGYPVYAGGSIIVGAEVRYLQPAPGEGLPPRPRRDQRRGGPAGEGALHRLSQQPHRGRGRGRLLRAGGGVRQEVRRRRGPRQRLLRADLRRLRGPELPERARAPRTWGWSSSASPSPST